MANKRDDLRTAPYATPGYLHERIAPTLTKRQRGGTLNYQPLQSDVTAQTGRTALGAITRHSVAGASLSFTLTEKRDRQVMSYDEINESFADQLHAELAMARIGKRAVDSIFEAALMRSLLGGTALDFSAESLLASAIESAASDLQDKGEGAVALVLSSYLFGKVKGNSEVKDRMKNTGVLLGAGGDPRNVTAAQLASVVGVDEVLVGNNRIWKTAAAAEKDANQDPLGLEKCAALVILPNGELQPTEEVQYARTLVYQYGEDNSYPFEVTSWEDDDVDGIVVDIKGYGEFYALNAGLKQAIKILA